MGFTTQFGLHSQATRLVESASCSVADRADGALTLSGAPFQGTWTQCHTEDASVDYNSQKEIFKLGFSLFARRY